VIEIKNFINNQFQAALAGNWLDVYEPATGAVYAKLTNSDHEDIDMAVQSARSAFPAWAALHPDERCLILNRIAALIESRSEELAQAESIDTGKPINLASAIDIPRSVANFRFFAAAASQFSSESHAMSGHAINYTLRKPLGVVGCISPWNLPLYLFTWKIAPALACGNTVVAKPSEITPFTASILGQILKDAGLPAGVVNIVHGEGRSAGASIVDHPDVKAVTFTGSTVTGKSISLSAANQFKKLSLEMGGKNPTLVFEDCDFDKTVEGVARSAFTNQGQVCLCGSRILIQDSIYESFRDALLTKVSELKAGDPLKSDTAQGAIVSKVHFEKVNGYIKLAKEEGGTILCGGPTTLDGRCSQGWFIDPVLIEGLPNHCRTNQEEIFGPLATLQSFKDEREAVALANQSEYGLACSIWSENLSRSHRLADKIECGVIWVNCWLQRDLRTPFGGMKSSGFGHEGGLEAMRFFTEPKNVCLEFGND
jgi:aminomuconate-semialdehyde/2-hydroxymuconate-6-semialdehyde dehydrogenase